MLLPAALLCFAGITKSAQLPFSSWLLGAMVAPTPVSALLHSSTMVKAGVYLVLRMAPVVTGTKVGMMVALVGAVTFVVGSLAAITTSEAKRVLAWSTVANLGLIVLCGGIGTYEAVWAGILLIIFHAVAKCLLFLCVGVVEHKLHSRNIEDMSGLVVRMPRVAIMMQIGMAGMFLAPFGMLISKWAVLKAVVDAYPIAVGLHRLRQRRHAVLLGQMDGQTGAKSSDRPNGSRRNWFSAKPSRSTACRRQRPWPACCFRSFPPISSSRTSTRFTASRPPWARATSSS